MTKELPPAIRITNLVKHYPGNDRPAIDGFSLSVEAGKLIALEGPSGSGKSTLLNILGGLDRPTSGSVVVGPMGGSDSGQRMFDLYKADEGDLSEYRGRIAGMVFQHHLLAPGLTAAESVAAPLLWTRGTDPGKALARAREILGIAGLTAKEADRRVERLSGGQRQRVAFARAVAPQPAILLADEPTSQLDAASAGVVVDLLLEWHRGAAGRILFIASHGSMEGLPQDAVQLRFS